MMVRRYLWKCRVCGEPYETTYNYDTDRLPRHCGEPMKRDYQGEGAGAVFKGGGWARQR